MADAANATTTRIGAHLGRRELWFMKSLHESALSARLLPQTIIEYTAPVAELKRAKTTNATAASAQDAVEVPPG